MASERDRQWVNIPAQRYRGSVEEEKRPLALVKCSPYSVAEQDLVAKKLVSSSLPLTRQTLSYGRIKAIFFSTLLVDSQPEPEHALLMMKNPQECNLAIVLPRPDIRELACSTVESLEQHFWSYNLKKRVQTCHALTRQDYKT